MTLIEGTQLFHHAVTMSCMFHGKKTKHRKKRGKTIDKKEQRRMLVKLGEKKGARSYAVKRHEKLYNFRA